MTSVHYSFIHWTDINRLSNVERLVKGVVCGGGVCPHAYKSRCEYLLILWPWESCLTSGTEVYFLIYEKDNNRNYLIILEVKLDELLEAIELAHTKCLTV